MADDRKSILTASKPAQAEKKQFLAFAVTTETVALVPVEQVVEILSVTMAEIVALPQMPECIVGVYNWRGEILWMVELGALLGYDSADSPAQTSTAVVVHAEGQRLGLIVSRVDETVWYPQDQIQPAPPMAFASELEPFLQGYLLNEDGSTLLVLDAPAILSAPLWQVPR